MAEITDLLHQEWNWRPSGDTWILATRSGGAKVILGLVHTHEGAHLVVPQGGADSRLIDLTPDHPIAVAIGEIPGLIELCQTVAAKKVADGEELTVDAARSLLARIKREKTDAAA